MLRAAQPRLAFLGADRAVIEDCQDSSEAGVADRHTGRHLTRGSQRNHVSATMRRAPDGEWRVAYISYPDTPC